MLRLLLSVRGDGKLLMMVERRKLTRGTRLWKV